MLFGNVALWGATWPNKLVQNETYESLVGRYSPVVPIARSSWFVSFCNLRFPRVEPESCLLVYSSCWGGHGWICLVSTVFSCVGAVACGSFAFVADCTFVEICNLFFQSLWPVLVCLSQGHTPRRLNETSRYVHFSFGCLFLSSRANLEHVVGFCQPHEYFMCFKHKASFVSSLVKGHFDFRGDLRSFSRVGRAIYVQFSWTVFFNIFV